MLHRLSHPNAPHTVLSFKTPSQLCYCFVSLKRRQTLPVCNCPPLWPQPCRGCHSLVSTWPLGWGAKGPERGARSVTPTPLLKIPGDAPTVPPDQNLCLAGLLPAPSLWALRVSGMLGRGHRILRGSPGLQWEGARGDVRHSWPACSQVSDALSEKPCQG